ncbi:MAG TPA: biopolymer transporter ExbD [Gemmataceae bacterium]|nr:biopolymer transporter ExbD [Gemmataceae bacterium]
MVEKRRFLDVWIVETNVVYREVPFAVVADWVQQGRLLEDDMLRPSGTKEWFRLGATPDFAPYLPKAELLRPDDQAEALEPVHLDIAWKHRADEEEDDPDMIPLIDVSLVLLIFFIMTTTAVTTSVAFQTPAAQYRLIANIPEAMWVGIDCDENRQPIAYLIGVGDRPADTTYTIPPEKRPPPGDREMQIPPEFLTLLDKRLDEQIAATQAPVEVVIKVNENLKQGYYLNLLLELQKRGVKVRKTYDGVREKQQP